MDVVFSICFSLFVFCHRRSLRGVRAGRRFGPQEALRGRRRRIQGFLQDRRYRLHAQQGKTVSTHDTTCPTRLNGQHTRTTAFVLVCAQAHNSSLFCSICTDTQHRLFSSFDFLCGQAYYSSFCRCLHGHFDTVQHQFFVFVQACVCFHPTYSGRQSALFGINMWVNQPGSRG